MANKAVDYVIMPDGTMAYVLEDGTIVPSGQQYVEATPTTQPQPPSTSEKVAGTAGNVTGAVAGHQIGSLVTGSGGGSASVATPQIVGAGRGAGSVIGSAQPTAPGVMSNFGSLGLGPQTGVVLGTLAVAKGAKDLYNDKKTKGVEGWAGRGQLAVTTGGLSEIARGLGLFKKSTKEIDRERWGNVSNNSKGWADVYSKDQERRKTNKNEGYWDETTDPTGKYLGKKWSWDAQRDIMETTDNYNGLRGALGNAETFGEDWFSLNDAQQDALVRKIYSNNGYTPDKGGLLIRDSYKDQARKDFEEIKNSNITASATPTIAPNPSPTNTTPSTVPTSTNGPIYKSASGTTDKKQLLGSLISPLFNRQSSKPQRAFSVPTSQDIIAQNTQNVDQQISPVADMETRMMQNPLVSNPLFGMLRG